MAREKIYSTQRYFINDNDNPNDNPNDNANDNANDNENIIKNLCVSVSLCSNNF